MGSRGKKWLLEGGESGGNFADTVICISRDFVECGVNQKINFPRGPKAYTPTPHPQFPTPYRTILPFEQFSQLFLPLLNSNLFRKGLCRHRARVLNLFTVKFCFVSPSLAIECSTVTRFAIRFTSDIFFGLRPSEILGSLFPLSHLWRCDYSSVHRIITQIYDLISRREKGQR